MSKIEFIKKSFKDNYKHEPEIAPPNILVHNVFGGCRIHTRSGIKTLIRMLQPKNILEIGSFHFETTNQMAYSLDELYQNSDIGHVHTFDIKTGGCDGYGGPPNSKRITTHQWIPHKTSYDDWKFKDKEITTFSNFTNMTNEQIFDRNMEYLKNIAPKDGFDMVYIDGDHSYQGTNYDYLYSLQVVNKDAILIADDIWDNRLHEVREFFDNLKNEKWDFTEWNLSNRDKVQNMGVFSPFENV